MRRGGAWWGPFWPHLGRRGRLLEGQHCGPSAVLPEIAAYSRHARRPRIRQRGPRLVVTELSYHCHATSRTRYPHCGPSAVLPEIAAYSRHAHRPHIRVLVDFVIHVPLSHSNVYQRQILVSAFDRSAAHVAVPASPSVNPILVTRFCTNETNGSKARSQSSRESPRSQTKKERGRAEALQSLG